MNIADIKKLSIDRRTIIHIVNRSKVTVISLVVLALFSFPLVVFLGFGEKDNTNRSDVPVMPATYAEKDIEAIDSRQIYQPRLVTESDHSTNPFSNR